MVQVVNRVIIAGSRGFSNYTMLKEAVNRLCNGQEIVIVSGCAKGADTLGEKYAGEHGCKVEKFPAQWEVYGKRAGYLRNEQMADCADTLIAFWDGVSKGTEHMISLAKRKGLKVFVVRYEVN